MQNRTKKIITCALLISVSLILSYIENILPMSYFVPGAKIGLANIVTLLTIYTLSPKESFIILITRIIIMGLVFTNAYMMIYSLVGGLLAYLVMFIMFKSNAFSIIIVSIGGATAHNIGQLLVASIFFSTTSFIYYLPYLLIIGVITGLIVGIINVLILNRFKVIVDKYLY
ncbi:MAG: Gx transporter family protein [Thomasclavelia sp.]|nr:Gx transporter family protein [Thomasclavelia sp.]